MLLRVSERLLPAIINALTPRTLNAVTMRGEDGYNWLDIKLTVDLSSRRGNEEPLERELHRLAEVLHAPAGALKPMRTEPRGSILHAGISVRLGRQPG
jgi:hypothetical protein